MRVTTYHFTHAAMVDAPRERVHGLLLDLEHYVEWWPQVRAVARLGPDDALLVCRSLLPYDLEVHVHAVSRDPDCLEVAVDGPLSGRVRWSLTALGPDRTRLGFEQQVQVGAWSLVVGSYLARPLLRLNHRWMMRGAAAGVRRRLGTSQPGAGQPGAGQPGAGHPGAGQQNRVSPGRPPRRRSRAPGRSRGRPGCS